jgi:hypothetical protein
MLTEIYHSEKEKRGIKMKFNKKINLALDCDEVLTYISPLWTYILHQNYDYFSKWFRLNPNYDKEKNYYDIILRDKFDLADYLVDPKVDRESDEYKDMIENRYFEIIRRPEFYKCCKPTRMANALAELALTSYVNKIYIISRVVSDNPKTNESKKKFLESIFKDSYLKLEDIIFLQMGESKGDIIRDLNNIDVYYDDELNNVVDVMLKKDPEKEMDIYIPQLNYNLPDESLIDLALSTTTGVRYYEIA